MGLDGGSQGHHLLGVDAATGLPAEELLHRLLHPGHAGHAPDQDHLSHLRGPDARVLEGLLGDRDAPVHQVLRQLLQLLAGELPVEVDRGLPLPPAGQEGQVDGGAGGPRELDLGALGGVAQPLERHLVLAQVDPAVVLGEAEHQPVDDAPVEVLPAEVGVPPDRHHVEDALADVEDGDVKGAAAQVEHHDLALHLLAEAVGEGRAGRLVDDPQHLQARRCARHPWWRGAARR